MKKNFTDKISIVKTSLLMKATKIQWQDWKFQSSQNWKDPKRSPSLAPSFYKYGN